MTDDIDTATEVLRAAHMLPETDEERARHFTPEALAVSALWYAKHGWSVFPLMPGSKVPAVAGGFKAASTDVAQVSAWWQARPNYNIGSPTGVLFDCIDIDAPEGFATWARAEQAWRAQGYPTPPTLARSETGSGGRHLFIRSRHRAGNSASMGPGLDYRGVGGYVVLPPSVLAEGGVYRWINAP